MKKKIPLNDLYLSDLAQLYFPKSTVRNAVTQLKRWIEMNPELMEKLEELHYKKRQRAFTPLQRDAIFHFLGAPEDDDDK